MRPPTRYIRLLTYENACKVIGFINKDDTGKLEDNYANITVGGVHTQVKDEDWGKVIEFLNGLNTRYEISETPPHEVEKKIVENLKQSGIISV